MRAARENTAEFVAAYAKRAGIEARSRGVSGAATCTGLA